MQHDIQWQVERRESALNCRPQPAPYSISYHCTPQNLAHRESYPRTLVIATTPIEGRDIFRKVFSAFLIHSLKIRVF
jgi:hypothetical protein